MLLIKIALGIAGVAISSIGYAQSLAVEQFDSLPGTLHDYAGSSSGWFTNWINQNDYTAADGYSIVDPDPMTHPDVTGAGNYCVGGGNFTSAGRYFDVPGSFGSHQDANGRIGTGTIYFRFLIRKEEDNDTPIEIILADDPGSAWAINDELIKIGYFGAPSNFNDERYWSVAAFNESDVALSNTRIAIGETYYIVVEINFATTTTINMWVNPTDGNPNLSSPDASVSSAQDLGFWNIVLFFDANGTGHGSFDEFFFSDDLEVVLPVEYTELYAKANNNQIHLYWTTATEISNERFIIEKLLSDCSWKSIGELPGNGDSNRSISYRFQDRDPNYGMNFYRLIQVDYDGGKHISKIVSTNYDDLKLDVQIFQNTNQLSFVSMSEIRKISMMDLLGKSIADYSVDEKRYDILLGELEESIYLVLIETENGALKRRIKIP